MIASSFRGRLRLRDDRLRWGAAALCRDTAWPDIGALIRRLDDGKGSKDGKPGNMYQHLPFGNEVCIEVLKEMGTKELSALTDEEAFMLGIMLGYDRLQQCARYLKRRRDKGQVEDLAG
jgi:hypothetical protein